MNKKVGLLVGIAVFILVLVGAYFAYNALADKSSAPGIGQSEDAVEQTGDDSSTATDTTADTTEEGAEKDYPEAPNFKVQDSAGNPVEFDSLKGKPIVLNFWASWCPPCIEELPIFDTVSQELEGEVVFVMVDLTSDRETLEDAKVYIKENNLKFPVYFDIDQDGAATYGITAIPTTYFINADGFVVAGQVGGIDESILREGIRRITE
jgi:thiol-disulfide isomerase/thioredoxin